MGVKKCPLALLGLHGTGGSETWPGRHGPRSKESRRPDSERAKSGPPVSPSTRPRQGSSFCSRLLAARAAHVPVVVFQWTVPVRRLLLCGRDACLDTSWPRSVAASRSLSVAAFCLAESLVSLRWYELGRFLSKSMRS
uniref:Putative secreted protein n=1 Tax=Ixodes ricinus TaxID=34613 RepID=A0A6B0USR0_IXORI